MTNELETRIKLWLHTLQKNLYKPVKEIEFTYFMTSELLSNGEALKNKFVPVKPGDKWGKEWEYGWFASEIVLGDWAKGSRIVMDLNIGGEAALYVDGEPFGSRRDDWIVQEHHFICDNYLTRKASGEETFKLLAECYAGHEKPYDAGECISGPYFQGNEWKRPDGSSLRKTAGRSTVGIWREEAYHLYLEASALYEIWRNEPDESLRRSELECALKRFCLMLEFEKSEEEFLSSVKNTREMLIPYLECRNASSAPVFHMIGHAHIDLAWLWPVEETKRKCLRTMAAQLRHMEEYPEYKMIVSQPWMIEQIETLYPSLYRKMTDKIKSGQLILEGGMWVESDANLPSGESMIRQFLYGKRYLKEKFGIDSKLLWLPDVFGYSGNLPQIMKGCGIEHFTTHKIFWTYNGGEPFPYNYFNWKGIDGTGIPTFIHVEYSSATNADTLINRWKSRAQKTGLKRILQPFGYGDGGGGPTRDHIENCCIAADLEGAPKTVFANPKDFFTAIKQDGYEKNEYAGELYYQAHRGTYTSQAKTKKGNRKGEFALREAEFVNTAAWLINKRDYPVKRLEEAWKLLLFLQFHDILPGSAIHRVYDQAEKEYCRIQEICADVIADAGKSLVKREENTVTFINSLSWDRRAVVLLPEHWKGAFDEGRNRIVTQKAKDGLLAIIPLPACGAIVLFRADAEGEEPEHCGSGGGLCAFLKNEEKTAVIENEEMMLQIDSFGRIISITDKKAGREWADGFCNELCLYEDIPGHFEAWDLDSLYRNKQIPVLNEGVLTVEEEGPLRAVIRIERTIGSSALIQWMSLEKESHTVAIRTKIDWKERHKVLKAAFPVQIITDEMCSEIQFGMIKRPNHTSRNYDKDRFEVCGHKWSALMENNRGFAILNDCKYGISAAGNCMELTLLKAAGYPDETADLGMQEFTYGFTFWNTSFAESDVVRQAYEMNAPVTMFHGKGETGSLFTVSNANIILDTVKAEESGKGIVLRLYEAKGGTEDVYVSSKYKIREVCIADMLEHEEERLSCGDDKVFLTFRPFEVKTILFRY